MQELTISNAMRGALGAAVARARYARERTTILVRGRPAALLVSLEDPALLARCNGAKEPARTGT